MASFAGLGVAFTQIDSLPEEPASFMGVDYIYEESLALRRGYELLAILKSRNGFPQGSRELGEFLESSTQTFPEFVEFGWLVAAIARFSTGSDDVKKLFFEIKNTAGFGSVPYWVCTESQRKLLLLSAARGPQVGEMDPMQNLGRFSRSLYQLIQSAEKEITERSGYQFDDYEGPVYTN